MRRGIEGWGEGKKEEGREGKGKQRDGRDRSWEWRNGRAGNSWKGTDQREGRDGGEEEIGS